MTSSVADDRIWRGRGFSQELRLDLSKLDGFRDVSLGPGSGSPSNRMELREYQRSGKRQLFSRPAGKSQSRVN